jgi:dUTP pyrophosphatase
MAFVFARLREDASAPRRKHPTDAGVDVFAAEDRIIWPFSMGKVKTGVTVEVPGGHVLFVWPKSGGNHVVGAGVIDAGYQGEVLVKILNYRPWPIKIKKGAPIAQLVQVPVSTEPVIEAQAGEIHQQQTARGASGGINR